VFSLNRGLILQAKLERLWTMTGRCMLWPAAILLAEAILLFGFERSVATAAKAESAAFAQSRVPGRSRSRALAGSVSPQLTGRLTTCNRRSESINSHNGACHGEDVGGWLEDFPAGELCDGVGFLESPGRHDNVKSHESLMTASNRRAFLLSTALASAATPGVANAAFSFPFGRGRDSGLLLNSREGSSSVQAIVGTGGDVALSAERCLLRLLPVRNPVFLALEAEIERLSVLKSKSGDDGVIPDAAWKTASNAANNALRLLDTKRDRLQPVFNQDLDSTEMQIRRAQRGEELIENLRTEIVLLVKATGGSNVQQDSKEDSEVPLERNATAAFEAQRAALLALAGVGELLVNQFPYEVVRIAELLSFHGHAS